MPYVPRSAVSRLALVAVNVLEDASLADVCERTALHKLALGYLLLAGITNARQVATFWRLLGHEGTFSQPSCRQSFGGTMLDGMRQRAKALAEQA